jgi:hypothetical protein
MNWGGGEDGKRVIVLRKCLRESMMVDIMKGRTIEKIVDECETDLSCRMVTASRAGGGGWRMGSALRWSAWSTGGRTPTDRRRLGTTSTSSSIFG